MFKIFCLELKRNIKKFIHNKKAADDKNTGSAMAMVFGVVIGLLLVTRFYSFFDKDFLPTVFNKIMDLFNLG